MGKTLPEIIRNSTDLANDFESRQSRSSIVGNRRYEKFQACSYQRKFCEGVLPNKRTLHQVLSYGDDGCGHLDKPPSKGLLREATWNSRDLSSVPVNDQIRELVVCLLLGTARWKLPKSRIPGSQKISGSRKKDGNCKQEISCRGENLSRLLDNFLTIDSTSTITEKLPGPCYPMNDYFIVYLFYLRFSRLFV